MEEEQFDQEGSSSRGRRLKEDTNRHDNKMIRKRRHCFGALYLLSSYCVIFSELFMNGEYLPEESYCTPSARYVAIVPLSGWLGIKSNVENNSGAIKLLCFHISSSATRLKS